MKKARIIFREFSKQKMYRLYVYALEFLDLDGKDEVTESDLEQAIMDYLQEFLLELGKGFCFEARQKRIIIDDNKFQVGYDDDEITTFSPAELRRQIVDAVCKDDDSHCEYINTLKEQLAPKR